MTVLLFGIGTVDVALGLKRDIKAFTSSDPIGVFNQLTDPISIVKVSTAWVCAVLTTRPDIFDSQITDFTLTVVIADVVLVRRT